MDASAVSASLFANVKEVLAPDEVPDCSYLMKRVSASSPDFAADPTTFATIPVVAPVSFFPTSDVL